MDDFDHHLQLRSLLEGDRRSRQVEPAIRLLHVYIALRLGADFAGAGLEPGLVTTEQANVSLRRKPQTVLN